MAPDCKSRSLICLRTIAVGDLLPELKGDGPMAAGRVEVWAQCIGAAFTAVAAISAAYTAHLVYGQLDAALITLHVDTQHRLYEAITSASQELSDTKDAAAARPNDARAAERLNIQARAFDDLINQVRGEHEARALPSPGYFNILYEVCPPFKDKGYAYNGTPLKGIEAARNDLDEHLKKN
jgi:hypothetical protein